MAWKFFGPSRVAEVTLGNGLIQTFMNNALTHSAVQPTVGNPSWGDQSSDRLGYDGAGRSITKRFLAGGINGSTHAYNDPTAIIGITASYDKASNKLYERELHAENRSHLYEPYNGNNHPTGGYDSLDRLRQYQRGTLASSGGPGNSGGGSITTPITLTNTNESAQYDLDGLGNWRRFITDPVGSASTTQTRQHNGLNEVTRTMVASTNTNFAYDGAAGASNGNLATDGTLKYEWDALNRLVRVYKTPSSPVLIGTYSYDAMNRRVRMVNSNGGLSGTVPNGTTDCLYEGWRCIEESDGSNNPTKQYVWGIYLDELIQQKNITALNNFSANVVLYPLQDLLYRTMALSDSASVIREAYDYDAYGNTLIFRNSGSPPSAISWTNNDTQVVYPTCAFLFTGQRYDAETGNYYYKKRYYSPKWGRFFARDPLLHGRPSNLFEYAISTPTNMVDKYGAQEGPPDSRLPNRPTRLPGRPIEPVDTRPLPPGQEPPEDRMPAGPSGLPGSCTADIPPMPPIVPQPRRFFYPCPNNSTRFFHSCIIDADRPPRDRLAAYLVSQCIRNPIVNMNIQCNRMDHDGVSTFCRLIARCFDMYY